MMMKLWLLLLLSVQVVVSLPAEGVAETRFKRQTRQQQQRQGDGKGLGAKNLPNCEFGKNDDLETCEWKDQNSMLKWVVSKGENAYWLGGPTADVNEKNSQGGYMVFETSSKPSDRDLSKLKENDEYYLINQRPPVRDRPNPEEPEKEDREYMNIARLYSPIIEKTGPTGTCMGFYYRIEGLSASQLRVYLRRVYDDDEDPYDEIVSSQKIYEDSEKVHNEEPESQNKKETEELSEKIKNIMVWQNFDQTNGEWMRGEKLYSFPYKHMLIFEGVAVDEGKSKRDFRGYVALDDIKFGTFSDCQGHCTFDGSFCSWEQNKDSDNFDWSMGRGSTSEATGPKKDHGSEMFESTWGGYAVIDSSYPRRFRDSARLESKSFVATKADMPLCMRFWVHMFGSGIGTLNVIYQSQSQGKNEKIIWQITGNQKSTWHQGQVPVASSEPFKIIFEGIIGRMDLGDIAIDDISFTPGSCVTSPQGANPDSGDCNFNTDDCGWVNPSANEKLDDVEWQRLVPRSTDTPDHDHVTGMSSKRRSGAYMTLHRPQGSLNPGGKRGWFMSNDMIGSEDTTRCISFWYYMQEPYIDSSNPSLGSLIVYIWSDEDDNPEKRDPIWRLDNHQGSSWMYAQAPIKSKKDYKIVFEGMWGAGREKGVIAIDDVTFFDGKCTTMPSGAVAMKTDCSFSRDTCQWEDNSGNDFRGSGRGWKEATRSQRPANLPDHTYNSPTGYMYFDVLSAKTVTASMSSPLIKTDSSVQKLCVTFWYAVFGSDGASELKLKRKAKNDDDSDEILKIEAKVLQNYRPQWRYSQVAVDANGEFELIFSGSSMNGGFALDDIQLVPQKCDTIKNDDEDNEI